MLPGRRGLSPVMVGRADALSRLLAPALGLPAGSAGPVGEAELAAVALVAGEAGVGKSRLLRELIARVSAATTVLVGQADPGSLGRPFDLLRDLLGASGPSTGPTTVPDGVAAGADAVAERLGRAPGLVVFEDLHWADAESVAVFERLATRPMAPNVLLIGSYRPDELGRGLPAADMLLRLERRRTVLRLTLDRLDRGEVAAFLAAIFGRSMPSSVADALYGRTGGNPFFLEELLASAADVAPERLASQPLPWTLAEVVRRQLDGVASDERRVVDAAAVLGNAATFDVLAEVTGSSEADLIEQLRRLVGSGLIVEADVDSFEFRHALVRDAVVGQLLGRERRRLHEAALAAIGARRPDAFADLARHAAGAGRFEEVVTLAQRGVRHYLDQGSTYQALRLAAEGLREAPDDVELLGHAAQAAWLVSLDEEALGYARRWKAVAAREGLAEEESAALRWEARFLHELRRVEEMWAATEELVARAERLPAGAERARALAGVAQIHMLNNRPQSALEWAERALAEADAVDAKVVRAQVLVEQGSALLAIAGRLDQGVELLEAAAADADALGEHITASRALSNWLSAVSWHDPRRADLVARLHQVSERAGYDALSCIAVNTASVGEAAANADRAEAERRLAITLARPGQAVRNERWAGYWEAFLALEDGEVDRARAALDFVEHLPELLGDERAIADTVALELAAAQGDGASAQRLVDAIAALDAPPFENLCPELVLVATDALVRAGVAPATGAVAIDRLVAGRDRLAAFLPLVDGLFAAADGRHADAVASLEAGLGAPQHQLPTYLRADARVTLSASLAVLGRLPEARDAASLAVAELAAWPGRRRARAEAQLRRVTPPVAVPSASDRSGAAGPAPLTARERQIAELVAAGRANSEIAAELYISRKTASTHVSNILAKLGLANRTELAAWAVRSASGPTQDA